MGSTTPAPQPHPLGSASALPGDTLLAWGQPWTPVCSLTPRHRDRIQAHLLALDTRDRYLRFGSPVSDTQIECYVQSLDFQRDELFGVFDAGLELIALAHLAYPQAPRFGVGVDFAEFGLSVLQTVRRRGLGAQLFRHAVTHARNRHVDTLHIYMLSENAAMLRIARSAGALIEREGCEAAAYLKLPPDTVASHLEELFEDQAAEVDYQFKCQLDHLARLMETMSRPLRGQN